MKTPSHNPMEETTTKSRDIADLIQEEASSLDPQAEKTAINLVDYIKMLQEYLNFHNIENNNLIETILPNSLLEKKLEEIEEDSQLKGTYPAGHIIQVTPLGCDTTGYKLEEDEILEQKYLQNLTRENTADSKTTDFGTNPNYIHKLLPAELQEASFIVKSYQTEYPHDITSKDRERIKKQYTEAFNKLKETLKKALGN